MSEPISAPPPDWYAKNSQEADKRFQKWKNVDPFPDIAPALLNSADIQDYVAATGMIQPFYPEAEKDKFKAASYEVDLLGEYVYWDSTGSERSEKIKRGTEFVLEANSIAFVTLEPYFRLPDYIALRFNLRITNVYRGLLLGTGPLIDPGFEGRLSIPLHNLTTNDYKLRGGEGLIWVEFTKVSPLPASTGSSTESAPGRYGYHYMNQGLKAKNGNTVKDYLRKAEPHRAIQSGIPAATRDAEAAAQQAEATTRTFKNFASWAAVALVVALASLFFSVLNLLNAVNTRVDNLDDSSTVISELRDRVQDLEQQLTTPPSVTTQPNQAPAVTPSPGGATP